MATITITIIPFQPFPPDHNPPPFPPIACPIIIVIFAGSRYRVFSPKTTGRYW